MMENFMAGSENIVNLKGKYLFGDINFSQKWF